MRRGVVAVCVVLVTVGIAVLIGWAIARRKTEPPPQTAKSAPSTATTVNKTTDFSPTRVYAHNLLLRKGPNFKVYVRWLQGEMGRLKHNVNPSFDDPESFYLDIKTGVLRANIGDIANYLNTGLEGSPMSNIKLTGNGDQVKLSGTVKKVVPLPVELIGTISATNDDRIHLQVKKLNVLKIPFKGLLGLFKISVGDLFKSTKIDGLEVRDSELFFDTQKLLPPPHIRGHLTAVRMANPDLEEVFGDAQEQVDRVEEWRNFLRLKGGTIDFGKLTMRNVDLMMIDISKDAWFNLDLIGYQKQLTNGFTRVTPEQGLQIFMPDLRDIPEKKAPSTSVEWFKNRNIPPPPEITAGKK